MAHTVSTAPARPDDVASLFQLAARSLHQGDMSGAEALFGQIIVRQPGHVDALVGRAQALQALRRPAEALASLEDALAVEAENPAILGNHAMALATLGRSADALVSLERALRVSPEDFWLLNNRANALLLLGRCAEALETYDRALMLNPASAEVLGNRARVLRALGQRAEALEGVDRALHAAPDVASAWYLRGELLLELERREEALGSLDHSLALNPAHAEAHRKRALALASLKRYEEAVASLDRALQLKPNDPVALNQRGAILLGLQRVEEALSDCERALKLEPRYAEALANRATAYYRLRYLEQALADYDRALSYQPQVVETLYNRANVLIDLYRFEEAARAFDDLLQVRPDYHYAAGYAFHSRLHCCDWSDLGARRARLIEAVASGEPADTPFQFLGVCDAPAGQLQCARAFIAHAYPAPSEAVAKKPRSRRERVRLAYLSADFGEHATSRLIAGLVESHDRARFEVTAVAFGHHPDSPLLARLRRGFDRFLDVRAANDRAVAHLLSELEIDIAVDLKGATGEARIGVFAYHVPPIQVSYLGYPGTMGAPFIDYLIADERVIAPDERVHYTENVVYLPECYQANDARREIAERTPSRTELGLPAEGFVFCSFSGCYKITPEVFDVWMRLLERVPGSVLWLREVIPAGERNLRSEAAQRGIDPQRLIFAPGAPQAEHLARHRAADLFLDTLPINAHTTASDALWAGLPLVSCRGNSFVSRVGASVLTAIGMPELITESLADYEALALRLATTPALLAETRARLARQRLTSPLFDTTRFCRHIEAAYTGMWERHLRGERPQSFRVSSTGRTSV